MTTDGYRVLQVRVWETTFEEGALIEFPVPSPPGVGDVEYCKSVVEAMKREKGELYVIPGWFEETRHERARV